MRSFNKFRMTTQVAIAINFEIPAFAGILFHQNTLLTALKVKSVSLNINRIFF